MTLETIMAEIRDELKRSNDLKSKQLQNFTDISEEPAGWTQLPTEEAAEDVEETKKAPKQKPEQPSDTESAGKDAQEQQEEPKEASSEPVADEAEMKKAVAKIIKGSDNEKKAKLKTKINEIGAKKVSDIKPEQRQAIIDYVSELDNG